MPKNKNKFVRVALEGTTIDGRKLTRDMIQQMADNYDAKDRYGARIWLEHFRSIYPDSTFKAYGDVLSLKTEENKDGKLGLYAEIDPTSDLLEINKQRQKVYTSIEMDPDFADTGEAYMVGLAVTDSPSSQGTEILKFTLKSDKFTNDHLYSEPLECDFSTIIEDEKEEAPSLFSKVKALFNKKDRSDNQRFNDADKAILEIAQETINLSQLLEKARGDLTTLRDEFEAFKKAMDEQEVPPNEPRKLAGGHDTEHHNSNHHSADIEVTDC